MKKIIALLSASVRRRTRNRLPAGLHAGADGSISF
jgi:hypothetical protein